MPYVDLTVTDREGVGGKGQPADPPAGDTHTRARAGARTRRIVAALPSVTLRRPFRRVADPAPARAGWEPRGLPDDLRTDRNPPPPIEEAAPTGFWWTGPEPPGRQWAAWWAQVQGAEHWAIRSWLLVTGLVLCLIGTAAALVTWVSQHPGAVLLLAVLCGLWWGALAADMEAAKTVGEGTR